MLATNALDPCDLTAPVVTHYADATNGVSPARITRTYRATDACGNYAPVTQTFTIPAAAPTLTLSASGPAGFILTVGGTPGASYILQATTEAAPPVWLSLVTNLAPFTFADTNAALPPLRLYRALTAP